MSIAKTLLAAVAAEKIAALRLTYSREIVAQHQLMLDRLQTPDDASPELRAVLAEVRESVSITEREGDCYPEVFAPVDIIRQAHAAGIMTDIDTASHGRDIAVGECYRVATAGHFPWTANGLDAYRPYAQWRAWQDVIKAAADAGL